MRLPSERNPLVFHLLLTLTVFLIPAAACRLPAQSFSAAHSFILREAPIATQGTWADFDGDGILDFVGNAFPLDLFWPVCLRGVGGGYFEAHDLLFHPSSSSNIEFHSADMNGDSRPDVLAITWRDSISVFINTPGELFPETLTRADDIAELEGCSTADLDGDADIDLAFVSSDPQTDEYRLLTATNDGAGTLTLTLNASLDTGSTQIIAGDFDGDGDFDLATSSKDTLAVTILQNDGTGQFTGLSSASIGAGPYSMECADLDGDSDIDIVVTNAGDDTISVLRNRGDGFFPDLETYPAGDEPVRLHTADLNSDGLADVVVANRSSDNLYVYLSRSASLAEPYRLGADRGPLDFHLADFDDDGDIDLSLLVRDSSPFVTPYLYFPNLGDGVLAGSQPQLPAVDGFPLLCDLDGDGDDDLILSTNDSASSNALFVQMNDHGHFRAVTSHYVGVGDLEPVVSDFDNDGDKDVVCSRPNKPEVVVFYNKGNGEINSARTYPVDTVIEKFITTDLNDDGLPDLIAANNSAASSPTLSVLLNGGGDGLTAACSFPQWGKKITDLSPGDFQGDGNVEVVVSMLDPDELRLFRWSATTRCLEQVFVTPLPAFAHKSAPGDLDGDRITDLVIGAGDGTTAVYLGRSDGQFAVQDTQFPRASTPVFPVVADFNRDGMPDIAVLCNLEVQHFAGFFVAYSEGPGISFTQVDWYWTGPYPRIFQVGDLDGDGDLDLLTTGRSSYLWPVENLTRWTPRAVRTQGLVAY